MFILAVETSTRMGSVALMKDDLLVAEVMLLNKAHHSQMVLRMIDHLLKEADVPLVQIGLFAVSIGPGSFTGLRVGIATMKGLATGLEKPVKGVPTLEAFARQVPYTPYPICSVIPARRNEVYTGLYQYDEVCKLVALEPAKVVPLLSFLDEMKGPLHILGDLPREWIDKKSEKSVYHSPLFRYPRASTVALVAYQTYQEGEGLSGENAVMIMPEYPSEKAQPDGLFL